MGYTNITAREIRLLAVLALIAGGVFDYLFNGKLIGVSYPLFAVVFYCLFWIASRRQVAFQLDFGWFLFIPILLLAIAFAIHSNPVLLALNFVLIPPLLLLQTTLLVYRYEWSSVRSVVRFLGRLLRQIFDNAPKAFLEVISLAKVADRVAPEKRKTLKNIFIGLILSVPLLVIVIALLAEADTVFQSLIVNALKSLEFIGTIPFAEHVAVIGITTVLLFGYLAIVLKAQVEGVSAPIEGDTGGWDTTIIATVLVMVNAVYILFCVIQFRYLFGGEEMIRAIPDYTYAEYARRGFSELIVVTVINLSILLIGLRVTKNDGKLDRLVFMLRCLLVLCTVIILYSAHLRLKLYEEAYGYTYARIFAHTFICLLFILFLLMLYKLWRRKLPLLKAFAIAALLVYTGLNYVNVDAMIARKNIDRYFRTDKIDLDYLQELSYDAIPELTHLRTADNEDMAAKTIAAFLHDKQSELHSESPWQSYNFSKAKAKRILSEIHQ
ncbi:DUF4173 domain-containing protein [Candidatus Poribacteria bacterium]|nr:MAG: DUF4173 domain-containing protein [Candidatus Poribacteria bacterium]